jgi:hypothetical protein
MAEFSLALNEDQLQIQKWVHDFAENVVRPAGHEWDEREETPWPIIEEAAKIGLYSFDFFANAMLGDATGLTLPITLEELFWGDAGIGLSIFGSGLAAAGIASSGTPEQTLEWVPQCFGTPDAIQLGAYCVSEPDAGSDVSSLKTRAVYDEANDEWVLNGTKAWITNGGNRASGRAVRRASSYRPAPKVCRKARSTRSTASVLRTPPKLCSTTCAFRATACSEARPSSTKRLPAPRRTLTPVRCSPRWPPSKPPDRQ